MKLKSFSQKDRYGNMTSFEFFEPDLTVPMMMIIPEVDGYNGADSSTHPGEPKGTDTVPAWLTPGENVVNAEASRLPGNQEKIDEMNEQGRAIQQAQGGPIPTYQAQGGKMPAANIDGNEFVKAAQAVGLSTDKSTLNKIVDLVNQGMSVTEAAKAVASKPVYSASGQKITKRKMPNGQIGLWKGNTYLGMQQKDSSFLGDVSDAAKEGWEQWNPFKNDGGIVPPVYSAGGMEVPRYDGMLNSLGQRLGDRDGGPMYSAVGSKVPSWLTDEVLDSLKMVESSGDPMATSEVGAQGLYQIMPATAQQPGMNVPPLAVEDIRDPVKSREFARNYLTGIASANPDFTPEEVLTAYHSGAGNVRKAKAGTEALGPRGQAYAGKIMDNMSDPDKFGVTRRKVVGNVPAPVAPVPEPIDFSQYSDPVTGPRVPTQIAGSEDQRIRDEAILEAMNSVPLTTTEIPKPTVTTSLPNEAGGDIDDAYNTIAEVPEYNIYDLNKDGVIDREEALAARDKLMNQKLSGVGTPLNIMPSGNQIVIDSPESALARNEQILEEMITTGASAEDIRTQAEKVDRIKVIPERQDAFSKRIAAEKEAQNKIKIAEKAQEKADKLKAAGLDDRANIAQAEANKAKQDAATATAEADAVAARESQLYAEVPKPDDDAPPKSEDTTETTQKKNAAGMIMQQLGPVNEITLEGEAGINQLINSLPKNPEVKSKFDEVTSEVGGWFKDTFSSMFSGPEIARMLVTYAGSRIMGYDHGDSLNYSMKNYVKRIDAQEKQYQEDIRSKDYQDFTEASRKEFEKTRDYSVLKKKPASLNIKKATGSFYVTGVGQMQAWEDDKGVQYIKVPGGGYKKASELGDLVQPYDKDVFGDKAVISSFSNYAEAAVAPANDKAGLTADDKNLVKINKQKIGEEANSIYRNILRSNGININNSDRIRQGIQAGIDSYMDAQAQYNKSGKKGTTPGNLESYIREQMITPLTGIDQVQITGTSPQNLKKLDDIVRRDMDIKDPRKPGYAEEYRAEWQAINLAWSEKLGDAERAEAANQARKRNEKAETSQWSAFTWWAANTPADEINALLAGKK